MEKDRILLFIPAYNCEKQIKRVLEQLDESVMRYITEVIVVNNRSTDDTEKQVMDFKLFHWSMPVKLLRNNDNCGLGGSHKVAFDYALKHGFEYVIVLHGDDQGNIHDFLPVFLRGAAVNDITHGIPPAGPEEEDLSCLRLRAGRKVHAQFQTAGLLVLPHVRKYCFQFPVCSGDPAKGI